MFSYVIGWVNLAPGTDSLAPPQNAVHSTVVWATRTPQLVEYNIYQVYSSPVSLEVLSKLVVTEKSQQL